MFFKERRKNNNVKPKCDHCEKRDLHTDIMPTNNDVDAHSKAMVETLYDMNNGKLVDARDIERKISIFKDSVNNVEATVFTDDASRPDANCTLLLSFLDPEAFKICGVFNSKDNNKALILSDEDFDSIGITTSNLNMLYLGKMLGNISDDLDYNVKRFLDIENGEVRTKFSLREN